MQYIFTVVKQFLILGSFIMICFNVSGQGNISKRYSGDYVSIKGSNVNFTIWLNKNTYGIFFNDPALQNRTQNDYQGDVVTFDFDYEGEVIVVSDRIFLSFNGERLFELRIIDSLCLQVAYSMLDNSRNDTLFKVRSVDDYSEKSHFEWIYTFYNEIGQDDWFTDIYDTIVFPIKPMWTYFDLNSKVSNQHQDTSNIHPLTRKYLSEIKY